MNGRLRPPIGGLPQYRSVTGFHVEDFDQESHIRWTIERTRVATECGDRPFGSVLLHDDSIILADLNRGLTEDELVFSPVEFDG